MLVDFSLEDAALNAHKACASVALRPGAGTFTSIRSSSSNCASVYGVLASEAAMRKAARNSVLSSSFSCVLVQRPALLSRGYGAGWDVILPTPWAAVLWNALTFSGTTAVRCLWGPHVFARVMSWPLSIVDWE